MFRLLFDLNPIVCSLGRYEQDILQGTECRCQLIYTFVMGVNTLDGPTELLDDRIPILLDKGDDSDVVLNIKENMNLGKSQTWFYFASTITSDPKLDFDYVGKMDTDTMPYLDKYFEFADNHLPPSPYNLRMMVGIFSNKAWWKNNNIIKESFFFLSITPGSQMARWLVCMCTQEGHGTFCPKTWPLALLPLLNSLYQAKPDISIQKGLKTTTLEQCHIFLLKGSQ
jgi:hypothetical protein